MAKSRVQSRKFEEYTSNLVTDRDLSIRFTLSAYKAARALKAKYYSLFSYMTEDDVVSALWEKILSQDISFDESKKNLDSFARMMVNNRCIDLSRMIRKHEGNVSLDSPYMSDEGESVTLESFIEDRKGQEFLDEVVLNDLLDRFSYGECISCEGVSLNDLFKELVRGKKVRDVAKDRGVSFTKLNKMLKRFQPVCINRFQDKGHTLEDILFNEDLEYFKNKDMVEFLETLSYVSDVSSGIKLSDVVKLLLDSGKEYTYSEIADKLSIKKNNLVSFLDKSFQMIF